MHDTVAIKEKVRDYIVQTVSVNKDKLKDDTLIFKEGYFDSMGFVLLITFLEEAFKIKTADSDLIEDNFESINAISDFITRRTS